MMEKNTSSDQLYGNGARKQQHESNPVNILNQFREKYLHFTDSARVISELDRLVSMDNFLLPTELSEKEKVINILKYIGRLHGLPVSLGLLLGTMIFEEGPVSSSQKLAAKVALALKYAVKHNKNFISLQNILNLLTEVYPVECQTDSDQTNCIFQTEAITQLMLTVSLVLNLERIEAETVSKKQLWSLQKYLPYVHAKYRSELRRLLEKIGYWSNTSNSHVGAQVKYKDFQRYGSEIIRDAITKRGICIHAHVVKARQTVVHSVKDDQSEKLNFANISISSALEVARERVTQDHIQKEAIPPELDGPNITSQMAWYRNTAFEIDNLYDKAKSNGHISTVDLEYLKNKFFGWRFSVFESQTSMIEKISAIFLLVSQSQKIDEDIMLQLLQHVLKKDFKIVSARIIILKAVLLCCSRRGVVSEAIITELRRESVCHTVEEKYAVADILREDGSGSPDTLQALMKDLRNKEHRIVALINIKKYIWDRSQKQISVSYQGLVTEIIHVISDSLEQQDRLNAAKTKNALIEAEKEVTLKALEILQEYLQLKWTHRLSPKALSDLSSLTKHDKGNFFAERFAVVIIASMEKLSIEKLTKENERVDMIDQNNLNHIFEFLFDLTVKNDISASVKALIWIVLSKVSYSEKVRNCMKKISTEHAGSFLYQLSRNDVISATKFLPEDEVGADIFQQMEISQSQHQYISDQLGSILVLLLEKNPNIFRNEVTAMRIMESLTRTKSKMTKIACAEFLFSLVTSRLDDGSSPYVFGYMNLNGIYDLTVSKISNVRILGASAFCVSLANQCEDNTIPLKSEHVKHLAKMYQHENVILDGEDFTKYINPNILRVFVEAAKQHHDIDEDTFRLFAKILGPTPVTTEEYEEHEYVNRILDTCRVHCYQNSRSLPDFVAEIVGQLYIASHLLREKCADIIESCIKSGMPVSELVLEEFSKSLMDEPSVSVPCIRRLAFTNENQELPERLFSRFQMELIAVRLTSTLSDDSLSSIGFTYSTELEEEIFKSFCKYASDGMVISTLGFNVIRHLLKRWRIYPKRMEIVTLCLILCVTNGQTLPNDIIESVLSPQEWLSYSLQLELAGEIIQRNQNVPPNFLNTLRERLENASTSLERSHILNFVKTMLHHNQDISSQLLQVYLNHLACNADALTPDIVASVIRVVENSLISKQRNKEQSLCKQIFKLASASDNTSLFEKGKTGLNLMPRDCFDGSERKLLIKQGVLEQQISEHIFVNEALIQELKTVISLERSHLYWKHKWNPEFKSRVRKEIIKDIPFIRSVGDILKSKTGLLTEIEIYLLETICISCVTASTATNSYNTRVAYTCREILESIVNNRKEYLPESCHPYLVHLKSDRDWTRNLFPVPRNIPPNIKDILADIKKTPNSHTIQAFLDTFKNSQTCIEYCEEIKQALMKSKNENIKTPTITETAIGWFTRNSSAMPAEPERQAPKIIELVIMSKPTQIFPLFFRSYINELQKGVSFLHFEECVRILVEYLRTYQNTMSWNEKALVFKILEEYAKRLTNLPAWFLETLLFHLSNKFEPVVRSECVSILRILLKNNLLEQNLWKDLLTNNLSIIYNKTTFQESDFTVAIFHALFSVSFVDVQGLYGKPESEWSHHLLSADLTLSLAKTTNEEIELFAEANEFCKSIHEPQEMLYIKHSIKDYYIKNSRSLTPGRILHFINILRRACKFEIGAPWKDPASVILNQILYGLIQKLNYNVETNIFLETSEVTLRQMLDPPDSIPLHVLDQLMDTIKMPDGIVQDGTFLDVEALLKFIKSNYFSNDKLRRYLKGYKNSISAKKLLTTLKALVLASAIEIENFSNSKIFSLSKHLIAAGYNFDCLHALFNSIQKAASGNTWDVTLVSQILENVLYQLVVYQVGESNFTHIFNELMSNPVINWVRICNAKVMDNLFAGSQGERSASRIFEDYKRSNPTETTDQSELLSCSESIVQNIQKRHLVSTLGKPVNSNPIHEWGVQDLQVWSAAVKIKSNSKEAWDLNLIQEVLTVLSQGCFLEKNYSLKSTQILALLTAIPVVSDNPKGKIIQVSTGCGKSTVIAVLACLLCLKGNYVDIYTSSPVLAERDAKAWRKFYQAFGFTCDHNGDKGSNYTKGTKPCYGKKVVYGDTSQYQFDALRDEYGGLGTRGSRTYDFALVDEADAMLVDDLNKLARLSSPFPGMDILHNVYHVIWQRLHDIQQRLFAVDDVVYYVEGLKKVSIDGHVQYIFQSANENLVHAENLGVFILNNQNRDSELKEAFIFKVENIEEYLTTSLRGFLHELLDKNISDKNQPPVEAKLPLPKALLKYAKSQVNNWVDAALTAISLSENVHYVVDQDHIKPVDNHSTGTIQSSTNWGNGLHQLLQIKHNLRVTTETLTTNFLSNMAMFKKYKHNLVGFTGTLGSIDARSILENVYSVTTEVIPDLNYKQFHELPAQVTETEEKWLQAVCYSATHESSKGRATLVICQSIKDAELISETLTKYRESRNCYSFMSIGDIKLYTRNDVNQENTVERVSQGDIVVATNLAGRGTDINSENVKDRGGLHVILTFLPANSRVEAQGFGRTARNGSRGTGEIIVISNKTNKTYVDLRQDRDETERAALYNFKTNELPMLQKKDECFADFCLMYANIRQQVMSKQDAKIHTLGLCQLEQIWLCAIEQLWATFLKSINDNTIPSGDVSAMYSDFRQNLNKIYMNLECVINTTENCYYWIKFGNEYYKRKHKLAQRCFEKAIDIDTEFASGAHAGIAFTLLREEKNLQISCRSVSIKHLKEASKILASEIGTYLSSQTLLLHRGAQENSKLYIQLSERIALLGEYNKYIHDVISTVRKSLRRVYITELESESPEIKRRWRLHDTNLDLLHSNSKSKFELEFHDLTCGYDMGRVDQAIQMLTKHTKIQIRVSNEDLGNLVRIAKPITTSVQQLELADLHSIDCVLPVIQTLAPKNYALKIRKVSVIFLEKMLTHDKVRLQKIVAKWKKNTTTFIQHFKNASDLGCISENEVTVTIYFANQDADQSNAELNQISQCNQECLDFIKSLIDQQTQFSVILLEVNTDAVERNWNETKSHKNDEFINTTNNAREGSTSRNTLMLHSFPYNESTFTHLSEKEATKFIDTLRDHNISFVLRMEAMDVTKTKEVLNIPARAVGDLKQKALVCVVHLFSSTYNPTQLIYDLEMRGLFLMPKFGEMAFVPWKTVVTLSMLTTVQASAGAALLLTGYGAACGLGLLTEAAKDLMRIHTAYKSRSFSWTSYASTKALSLTLACVTTGYAAFRNIPGGIDIKQPKDLFLKVVGQTLSTIKNGDVNLAFAQYITKGGAASVVGVLYNMTDSCLDFSFDSPYVRSHIFENVEIAVTKQFQAVEFFNLLRQYKSTDKNNLLFTNIQSWILETIYPHVYAASNPWANLRSQIWNLIHSNTSILGSKFSFAVLACQVIFTSNKLAKAVEIMCQFLQEKLNTECSRITPSYVICRQFNTTLEAAEEIVNGMSFSQSFKFDVTMYPSDAILQEHQISSGDFKSLFSRINQMKTQFLNNGEEMSRLIKIVSDNLTDHIVNIANRELAQPIVHFGIATSVDIISKGVQDIWMDQQNSKSTPAISTNAETNSSKAAIMQKSSDPQTNASPNDSMAVSTHNASSLRINYKASTKSSANYTNTSVRGNKEIVSTLERMFRKMEKTPPTIPNSFSEQQVETLSEIIVGKPPDMAVVLKLSQINRANIHVVTDSSYKPTKEEMERNTKVIVWNRNTDGESHYMLTEAMTGISKQFCADELYSVLADITEETTENLKAQALSFVACDVDSFTRLTEAMQWLDLRYPEKAEDILYFGPSYGSNSNKDDIPEFIENQQIQS